MASEVSCCRRVWAAVSSPVGLLILLVAYSFAGAALFKTIEGPHESHEKHEIAAMRTEVIDNVWKGSGVNAKNKGAFTKLLQTELRKYEAELHGAFAAGVNSDSEETVWDFWGSMVYAATIYTTIGYGHMAPATNAGKVATMVYAAVGIPLCLIVLAELGKLLTLLLKAAYSYPRRMLKLCKAGDENDYAVDEEFNLPVGVAVGVSVLYMLLGALMYQVWEDWSYLDGFYFIFISISTVGFGDILPSDNEYFLMSFAYQLFGLALVAMVINVIMEALQIRINLVRDRVVEVGKTVGVDLSGSLPEEKTKAE